MERQRKQKSYQQLRLEAKTQSDKMASSHPCRRGLGICCQEKTIPVTPDDQKQIISGVQSGRISRQTLESAQKNANDSTWSYCAFYDAGKGVCRIYKDRPLICITTGTGGLPSRQTPTVIDDAIEQILTSGRDPGVPVKQTTSSMCSDCYGFMAGCGMRFSTEGMVKYNEAVGHYGSGNFIPMADFVRNIKVPKTK